MSPTSGGSGDGIGWYSAIMGLVATVLGMFAGMIKIGKSIEQIEEKARAAKEQSDENERNIQHLQLAAMRVEALEVAMKQVLSLFQDDHGNQRIVTTYVCDRKAEACNLVITERMRHMAEMFGGRITAVVERMDQLEEEFGRKQDAMLKTILDELRVKK